MTPEQDKLLCEKYPKIFAQRHMPMDQTCMCWGFDCESGWFKLIDELCGKLQAVADTIGVQAIAAQVKEKYGSLRFYYDIDVTRNFTPEHDFKPWYDIIDDLVEKACSESEQTCEECGEHGEMVVRHGWWMTRCKRHSKEPACLHRYTKWLAQNEIKRLEEEEEEERAEKEALRKAIADAEGGDAIDIPEDALTGGTLAADEQIAPDEFCKGVMEAFEDFKAGRVVPMDDVLGGPPGKEVAETCGWATDEEGWLHTECRVSWQPNFGGGEKRPVKVCPWCGKRAAKHVLTPEDKRLLDGIFGNEPE